MAQEKTHFPAAKRLAAIALALFLTGSVMTVSASAAELVAGGRAVGISITTQGVVVSGLCAVETAAGEVFPAERAGLQKGDVITRLGAAEIKTSADFIEAAEALTGESVSVTVRRGEKTQQLTITPAADSQGKQRLGLWLRDGVTGVGTITFYDPETGIYGALGHGITDSDSGELLPMGAGELRDASIVGVIKGAPGAPGELTGCSDANNVCGSIVLNTQYGIFGYLTSGEDTLGSTFACGEMKTGPATIISTVDGEGATQFAVQIERVYREGGEERALISVTDDALITATGDIVQGMSGSPVIQDGQIVGAVTHVLVDNPCRGYALSIGDMTAAAEDCLDAAA